jgi:hypothetical protein
MSEQHYETGEPEELLGEVVEFQFEDKHVRIIKTENFLESQVFIDGIYIPVNFHSGYKRWESGNHTIYGFMRTLERFAKAYIISNPSLAPGHHG